MSNPVTHEINERERINSHLAQFWSLPTWTPAMGSLLVCGVSPTPNCIELPTSGADLRTPGTAAPQRALHDARRTLADWYECWEIRVEEDPRTEVPTQVDPIDFLLWCWDEYQARPDWVRPPWLRYWLAFTGIEMDGDAPLPAPTQIVSRAAELEAFATVWHSKATTTQPGPHEDSPGLSPLTLEVVKLIESEGRSAIKHEIAKALKLANDPGNAAAVWVHLCEMARSGKHPTLRYLDDATLEIPRTKKPWWRKYQRDALEQYLERYVRRLT
jgi:hypothetical protein